MKKEIANLTGLILEGISGSGKTTIIKALLSSHRYLDRDSLSSIILSEHHTQRVLEKKQRESGLIKEDSINLLNDHIVYLENLDKRLKEMTWCRQNQTAHHVALLIERFHLTHLLQYDHINWDDLKTIDSRLVRLNVKLCILTATEEQLDQRLFETRDLQWNNYIKRFGNRRQEVLNYFFKRQENLLSLAEESNLPILIFNPSQNSLPDSVEKILDFWKID